MSGPIYCVGNIGIDVRVTPDAQTMHPAGTTLRCTLGAALFGLTLTPIAVVGPEPEYTRTFNILCNRGVQLDHLSHVANSIRFTTRYDANNAIAEFNIEHREVEDAVAMMAGQLDVIGAQMVVVCPMPFDAARNLLTRAKTAGAETVLVIHYGLFASVPATAYMDLLPLVDVLILNLNEGQAMTELAEVNAIGTRLAQACRRAVYLTLHDRGATVFTTTGETCRQPSIAPRVANVLGAGDTFAGGVIAGLHFTGDARVALTYGMLASLLVLATPDHAALLAAMEPCDIAEVEA